MIKNLFLIFLFFSHLIAYSQTDTLFTKTQKISCKSIKIKTDSISYKSIDTETTYSISKKEVDKIVYKNGKVFSVKEDMRIVHVDGVSNFNDVVITFTASDTIKSIKIEDLLVDFDYEKSGHSKHLEKTYKVLKILASMKGANIIYVPEQKAMSTDGINDSSITHFYGTAYCSSIPTLDEFDKKIGERNEFNATEQWYLPKGKTDVYQLYFNGKFIIDEIIENDGYVIINGELKGFPKVNSFRLISISSKFFTVNFEMNNVLYNVQVTL